MKNRIAKVLPVIIAFCAIAIAEIDALYMLSNIIAGTTDIYKNEVEGYAFDLPKGYAVDESFLPEAVRFVSNETVIEIYAETCANQNEILSYINYTNNGILSNLIDYHNHVRTEVGASSVLSWERRKLLRVENDRNYYMKIDIPYSTKVYTVLVKSSVPISGYEPYLSAFSVIRVSGNSYPQQVKKNASGRKFNLETYLFYNKYFKNSKSVEWGIYQPKHVLERLEQIETAAQHEFEIVLMYSHLREQYNPSEVRDIMEDLYEKGKITELTLQHELNSYEGNDLLRLLDGYYDEFLNAYAADVANFGHPVLFRFANEMNGDWCEYSAFHMSLDTELYRLMYKYVYDIFAKNGANNVIWVWNPNGKSFPDYHWNSEGMYYPGDLYVDVLGLTLYNTGTYYEGEKWIEFDELYKPLYERAIKKYNMPFMITEFSCARVGGNKEEWTRKMLESIGNYPEIKIAIWWNGADFDANGNVARAYYIDDSQQMLEIFKNYFSARISRNKVTENKFVNSLFGKQI